RRHPDAARACSPAIATSLLARGGHLAWRQCAAEVLRRARHTPGLAQGGSGYFGAHRSDRHRHAVAKQRGWPLSVFATFSAYHAGKNEAESRGLSRRNGLEKRAGGRLAAGVRRRLHRPGAWFSQRAGLLVALLEQ